MVALQNNSRDARTTALTLEQNNKRILNAVEFLAVAGLFALAAPAPSYTM